MISPSAATLTCRSLRGDAGGELVKRVVGAVGLVVEQQDPPGAGPAAEADGVVGRRVAERGLGRDLLGEQEARRGSARPRRSASSSAAGWYAPQPSGPGPSAVGQ